MRVIFTTIATQELEDAVRYYELEYSGLGHRFKDEVRKAALRIAEYPQAWSIERGDVRKCLLHKFPYKLMYSVEEYHILVIAVAHQHRKPDYWVGRDEK
ncbi:type II toxin-antitoxin system RelE/ParE family toxin [Ectothiorhodospira sp. 9100]|nr:MULTISPECIES: type II toxin-antitoxin system RelE/ParE family toxin [unclassified Ectothiorhodospira]MCG5517268.1 type II toxin-antitoxin system RelE/ParE family toxin [Ectothiorhodospira sp. 9100]MCG5520175.1 type II toxin-antitoxin system RelE/ParE family toxin [Ectothiorhodospira sp. 9905]